MIHRSWAVAVVGLLATGAAGAEYFVAPVAMTRPPGRNLRRGRPCSMPPMWSARAMK